MKTTTKRAEEVITIYREKPVELTVALKALRAEMILLCDELRLSPVPSPAMENFYAGRAAGYKTALALLAKRIS